MVMREHSVVEIASYKYHIVQYYGVVLVSK